MEKMEIFSPEQKRYLIDTWRRDDFEWLYHIGTCVYTKIFELAPSAKQLFPYVIQYEAEGRNWQESKEFQNQALRFVQALGKGVWSLEDDDERRELEKELFDLGKNHRRFESRGFIPEYWNVWEIAVAQVMREEVEAKVGTDPKLQSTIQRAEKEKMAEMYALLANYIISQMKKGFYDLAS